MQYESELIDTMATQLGIATTLVEVEVSDSSGAAQIQWTINDNMPVDKDNKINHLRAVDELHRLVRN